jgi:hypothetical protein
MLDRVIDAPVHQGRTDLDQALAQAVWEGHCFPSLACITSQALSSFLEADACNRLKGVDCLLIAKAVIH